MYISVHMVFIIWR